MRPATNLDVLVLAVLGAGPVHGYGLISAMRDGSGGTLDFPEGTVYPVLHRLENEGLVASSSTRVDGRLRRVYALTPEGHQAAAEKVSSWRTYAAAVESLLTTVSVAR